MEKQDSKKMKFLVIGIIVFIIIANVAFAMAFRPLVQKSSKIEEYMRPGIDNTTDAGTGVKPLVAAPGTETKITAPGTVAIGWITEPIYHMHPNFYRPAPESALGNVLNSDSIEIPSE